MDSSDPMGVYITTPKYGAVRSVKALHLSTQLLMRSRPIRRAAEFSTGQTIAYPEAKNDVCHVGYPAYRTRMSQAEIRELLTDPRFELLPFDGMEAQAGYLPDGAKVAITASPEKGVDETVDRSVALAEDGFELSAHVAARAVRSEDHLEEIATRLQDAGIEDVFVPGGDNEEPEGPYDSSFQLLRSLDELGYTFEHVGITGYPEGHQFIEDDVLWEHLEKKAPYADYVVTQMSFDPEAVVAWSGEVRNRGFELPVHVGVPGVMRYQRLLSISQKIGVGDSLDYLRKTTGIVDFVKQFLGSRGQFTPDDFVAGIAPYNGDADYGIEGVHLYTFNQAEDTERWRREYV